jgi:hypothetical protein
MFGSFNPTSTLTATPKLAHTPNSNKKRRADT